MKLYNRLLIRHINRHVSVSAKNDTITHYPVAIVGGGPVGLLLSLLLSQYNVKHILFEKRYLFTSCYLLL